MTTRQRWAKTLQVLMVAIAGLGVGVYVADFSGSAIAWAEKLRLIEETWPARCSGI